MADNISRTSSQARLSPWQRLRAHPNWKWLTPGIGVKRWLALFLVGITLLSLALTIVLVDIYRSDELPEFTYYLTLQFLPHPARTLVVGVIGLAALAVATYQLS